MTKKKKEIIISITVAVVAVVIVVAVILSLNPKRNYETVNTENSEIITESTTAKQGYPFNVDEFAKKGYELKYMFSVSSFNAPKEISINKLVQYAFCHIYYDNLVDMPSSESMTYKKASASQINKKLKDEFGLENIQIAKSDLYNSSEKIFEMWQPNYHKDIYLTTTVQEVNSSTYTINSVYYSNSTKSEKLGNSSVTITKAKEGYYISKLS